MAKYAKFFSVGGGAGPNGLQLPTGTILDTTLRQVQDGTGTGSPLYLSTTGLRVGTTAASAMYWDNVNNRLGIGTSSPTAPLEVRGTTNNSIVLRVGGLNSGRDFTFNPYYATNVYGGLFSNDSGNITLGASLGTDNGSGIGIILGAPSGTRTALLQLKGTGSTSATTSLLVQNSGGTNSMSVKDDGIVTFHKGTYLDALSVNTFHSIDTGDAVYGGIALRNNTQNYTGYIQTGRSGNSNSIVFLHTTYGGASTGAYNQRFSSTSVELGYPSAPNIITLHGNAVFNISDTPTLYVNGATNTTNTGAKLAFQCGTVDTGGPIDSGGIIVFKTNIGTPNNINTRMVFYNRENTTLVERMRIADSGNVLIGNTTGTARLTVQGSGSTSATTSLLVQNSAGTNAFQIQDDLTSTFKSYGTYFTHPTFNGSIRIENTGNYTQRIAGGGGGESIVWGPGNTIVFNSGETYVSSSFLGGSFWIQPNGAFCLGQQATAHASSLFDMRSTSKGFLTPRMTNAQRLAISSPAIGLEVYCTDAVEGKYIYKSTGWTFIA